MSPERWARIKEVFNDALELGEAERAAFLDRTCASDAGLRQEVERLIGAGGGTLEGPLRRNAGLAVDLARGEMLGHYRVESKVGQGAMGAVYRACDTRLNRRVALKVMREGELADAGRKQRFHREALAASALAHPNIVTIHDVGTDHNIDFIAMEYVEGRPLDQLIPADGMPLKQALAYAIQIAGALTAAHADGVVHRDLKPRNIMITREGLVKLLDFGLARRTSIGADEATLTMAGEILGTPAYMSPEQVRGEPADQRSDLFSFGAVLYEMVTGCCAFDRGSTIETMNAILKDEPPALSGGAGSLPFAIQSIILHCLEKDRAERFQFARDLAYALEAAAGPPLALSAPAPAPGRLRRYAPLIVSSGAGFALACLLAAAWVGTIRSRVSSEGRVFAPLTAEPGAEAFPSLSPDGKLVVYAGKASGNWDIYFRRVGEDESVNLTSDSPEDDTQPAFAPDGRRIAFRSDRGGGGVFVMSLDGRRPRLVAEGGYNPGWAPDGKSIYYAEEGVTRPEDRAGNLSHLWAIEVDTGRKRMLGKDDAVQPACSPSGRHVAYWAIDLDGHRDIWTRPVNGGQPVRITNDEFLNWNPVWSPDRAYLYFCSNRGGNTGIWRIPIKESSAEPRGAPEPIRTPASYTAHLAFSRDGRRMAYVHQATTGRLRMVRFDPDREVVLSEPKEILQSSKGASRPALSPDGRWLAFNTSENQEDLFVVGADGSGLRQVTSGRARYRGPRWSPDGKQLAFFSTRSGDWEIWTMELDGGRLRQVTNLGGQNVAWPVWAPDGKRLAYTIFGVSTFLIDPAAPWGSQTAFRLPPLEKTGELFNGWSWSPDGRMLAGFLNRGDGIAVYFPADRSFRKLTDVGSDPVWLRDSRRLLFHHRGTIRILDSETSRHREVLAIAPEDVARRGFSVSADDRQIYFSVSTTEADVWMLNFER